MVLSSPPGQLSGAFWHTRPYCAVIRSEVSIWTPIRAGIVFPSRRHLSEGWLYNANNSFVKSNIPQCYCQHLVGNSEIFFSWYATRSKEVQQ